MTSLKSALRQRIQKSQPASGLEWPGGWDRFLCAWLKNQPAGIWGAFAPLGDEPPLLASLKTVNHLDWVFPRVIGENLEFCRVADGDWVQGPFSQEPSSKSQVISGLKIQGLLIPGLAFDQKGYRLGRGGGFYDRYLQTFTGKRVGVIHSSRILDQVPTDVWDQRVEWIASEQGVFQTSGDANSGKDPSKKES